ncbi:MAG TPA: hypothetical protein VFC39_08580, partial [Acidobacteriaceae bacterium]|nr:hypothetical protein [Acidobacteriaceae bacterium]
MKRTPDRSDVGSMRRSSNQKAPHVARREDQAADMGIEQGVADLGCAPRRKRDQRSGAVRLRITAEPARRDHSACADAQQNDGQHRREDAIRSVDEELQEAKPDHLQRQQRRTRQKRRPEQTPGAGAERRVSGGCLGKRRRRVFFQTAGQRRGYQGHRQIDRPGSQCRRPQPQPFNQPQLSAERAGQCPERVPAIQTAKHAPEVGVPARAWPSVWLEHARGTG